MPANPSDLSHARTRRYCIGLYCWHHMPLQAVRAQVSQCLSCGNLIQQRTQQGLHESISVEIRSWPLADTLALLLKARGTSVQQQCLHCNMTVHAQAVRARTRRTRSSLTVSQLRQSHSATNSAQHSRTASPLRFVPGCLQTRLQTQHSDCPLHINDETMWAMPDLHHSPSILPLCALQADLRNPPLV